MKLLRYCLSTALSFILINNSFSQTLTADFISDPSSGCSPLTVNFTNTSSPIDGSTTYSWNFGNGNTSTQKDPQAVYTLPGNYTVTLSVTNSTQTVSVSKKIIVYRKPTANFTANVQTGCTPLDVKFTSIPNSGDTISAWSWYFGDGGIGNSHEYTYKYLSEGKYKVYLEVTNNHGCTDKKEVDNFIDVVYPPVVGFTATPTDACKIPALVRFKNTTPVKTGVLYGYKWIAQKQNDPGGTQMVSLKRDTSFNFTDYGVYDVNLEVENKTYGCASSASLIYTVSQVKADGTLKQGTTTINATGSLVCAGEISFQSTSILPPNGTVYWDFGDGSDISTDVAGTHRYENAGTYTVKLVAEPQSTCQNIKTWTFTVEKVTADFWQQPLISCEFSTPVVFTNKSTNAVSYEWEFADGSKNFQTNTSTTYSVKPDKDQYVIHKDSVFTTKLTAISTNGCKNTISKSFIVKRPTALFTVDTTSGCTPLKVRFKDNSISDSAITSRLWIFDNGQTSSQTTKTTDSIQYLTPGIYYPKLVIATKNGCKDTSYTIRVRVGQPPVPDFSFSPATPCQNNLVTITDLTTSNKDAWEYFINGTPVPASPSDPNPVFRIRHGAGTLAIKQKVGYNGCYAETTKNITYKGPSSSFTYEVDCTAPHKYTFKGNPTGTVTQHKWLIDGTTYLTQDATHSFPLNTNADFQVKYIVSGDGCADTLTQTVKVRKKIVQFTLPAWACANTPVELDAGGSQPGSNVCFDKYIWNFNDSTPEVRIDQDLQKHTFTERGSFKVLLTAIHDNGCKDTLSKRIRIYKPYAFLKSSKTGGCPGVSITFRDSSKADNSPDVNPLKKWIMDYGDNVTTIDTFTSSPGTMQPYSYIYAGYYTSYLKVIDQKNCVDSSVIYIGVDKPDIPVAVQNPVACANEEVTFIHSAMDIDDAFWKFGDGTTLNSKAPLITHKYTIPGNFTATVIAYRFGCSDSAKVDVAIDKANATFIDSISDCPALVKFTHSAAASNINTGEWNLGDGTIRPYNPASPFSYHTYKPGNYNVKLTVFTDEPFRCRDTVVHQIKIAGPKGTLDIVEATGCVRDSIHFIVKDTADITKFELDYGDGTPVQPTGLITTHAYSNGGKKIVALVLYQNSCKRSETDSVTIDEVVADFAVYDKSNNRIDAGNSVALCENDSARFTNLSTGHVSQIWSLGPGKNFPESNVSFLHYPQGTYALTLSVLSQNNCSDTAKKELKVYPDFPFRILLDTSKCDENKVLLKAMGGNMFTWLPQEEFSDPNAQEQIVVPEITRFNVVSFVMLLLTLSFAWGKVTNIESDFEHPPTCIEAFAL